MADLPAKIHQKNLEHYKENVEKSHNYYKENYERFNEFRKLVFESSLTAEDISSYQDRQMPQLEFNILESFISRLRGEFSKQEPSIMVTRADGSKVSSETVDFAETHLRAVLNDANRDGLEYNIYTDLLSGGFSACEVVTDYAHPMSFNQNIYIRRVFDPLLCGFDPIARDSHKGDGEYCFKITPFTRDQFISKFQDVGGQDLIKNLKFTRNLGNFNWAFANDIEKVILVCEYYKKKRKKEKIVQLVTGDVMTEKQYQDFLEVWKKQDIIQQPPALIGKPRDSEFVTIERVTFYQDNVLRTDETIFSQFPLVFAQGNTVQLRHSYNGTPYELTRPYVYHAKGVQKLKNFAGITLANAIENMIQHKFMVAKESIPSDYAEAYQDVQHASILVYNAFKDNDPNIQLPPPQVINLIPTPPEVINTFSLTDEVTQAILGNYDASIQKMSNSQLSGTAIVEAATLSNAAAMPYVVGFMRCLNRVAEICVDLFPKIYVTPRTIPVIRSDGKRSYVNINDKNDPESTDFTYAENSLQVKVEAGLNYNLQKEKSLLMLDSMMKASPTFAEFMNTNGLPIMLDNLDIKGIDNLKKEAEKFMEEKKSAMEQGNKNKQDPMVMQAQAAIMTAQNEAKAVENQRIEIEYRASEKASELAVMQQKAETERVIALGNLGIKQDDQELKKLEVQQDMARGVVDANAAAVKIYREEKDQSHKHALDIAKHNREERGQGHEHALNIAKHHQKEKELDNGLPEELANLSMPNEEVQPPGE